MGIRRLLPRPATTLIAFFSGSSLYHVWPFVSGISARTTGFVMMGNDNSAPPMKRGRGEFQTYAAQGAASSFGERGNTSNANDSNISKETNSKNNRGSKRKHRPGMNSYLKVVLDDDTIDYLHQSAIQLQGMVEQMSETSSEEETQQNNDGDEKKSRRRKKLTFRPRSRDSLHLTFFFGGEVLCELPPEELTEWHSTVSDRLKASNFVLRAVEASASSVPDETASGPAQVVSVVNTDPHDDTDHSKEQKDDYGLTLCAFSLFPPRKNYLIVARLDASAALNALHDDVRSIAQDRDSKMLASVVKRSKDRWTPHITLGNLYGGTKDDLKTLGDMLESFPGTLEEDSTKEHSSTVPKVGIKMISMGGPMPQQASLDWDFYFNINNDKLVIEK